MKYDLDCEVPSCYLVSDDDATFAQEKSLHEIQVGMSGIQALPNLTIIDAPGPIAAAPGRKIMHYRVKLGQWRRLNYSASFCGKSRREMVLLEIAVGVFDKFLYLGTNIFALIILTNWSEVSSYLIHSDWKSVLGMTIDPELSKTIVGSTKRDTRIP
ncbi:hypothetical protein NC653_039168 [Populus alba x Populus x berolinensis]|uniref:Uncharacterized protein n=1 Tax=Populus alba x Populus x berolinensis TaxID=444605 RepID=A0AAD6PR08_9ROSI|nr:hypothetical protein NC653_039168 [Populus alba x Populus x berolinensis]